MFHYIGLDLLNRQTPGWLCAICHTAKADKLKVTAVSIRWRWGQVIATRSVEEEMHVREVIPFGKSDWRDGNKREREREKAKKKKTYLWREEERGRRLQRCAPSELSQFIICILKLSKSGSQLHIAISHCSCLSSHIICFFLAHGLNYTSHSIMY